MEEEVGQKAFNEEISHDIVETLNLQYHYFNNGGEDPNHANF